MATIEKLVRSFEALKVFQPVGGSAEEPTKKKEPLPSKKDKMINCNVMADCICAPNMRSIADFPKFLGIAMETFLMLCDDPEADIRMVADECLNKTIKTLLETNLGRLQVELYKEIKKNGPSRSLRGALWRFADMCHLIRPQKCRPYIVNLLPCIARVCKREEEAIQETLAASMQKICPVLMAFANDSEVKALLKSFLPNLKSSSASTRRTAASSLSLICQHSHNPLSFINRLVIMLLDLILPVDEEHEVHYLLGVLLAIRNLVPYLTGPERDLGLKGSFGLVHKGSSEKHVKVNIRQILQVYELLLYFTGHTDHNVATAALEGLHQLIKTPPPQLIPILVNKNTIKRSSVYSNDLSTVYTRPRTQSGLERFPSVSDDVGLEEDQSAAEIYSQITTSEDSSGFASDFASSTSQVDEAGSAHARSGSNRSNNVCFNADLDEELPNEGTFSTDLESTAAASVGSFSENTLDPVIITMENAYTNVEIGDLNEERSERSTLSHSSSVETLLSIKSLSPKHRPPLQKGVSQDLNGNPEYDNALTIDTTSHESASPSPIPAVVVVVDDVPPGVGHYCDGEVPLVYCIRLLCRRFLLSGTPQGLISDKTVRVSVKTLALGTIGNAISLFPRILLHNVFVENHQCRESQYISDVLLFANHPDPQLKGNTAVIVANLLRSALIEGQGDFQKWLEHNSSSLSEKALSYPSVVDLVQVILNIIEDESSMAARQGLLALQVCLSNLMVSAHSDLCINILLKLLPIISNPYWLVKVELLELVSKINFKIVYYLQSVCLPRRAQEDKYLGKFSLQTTFLEDAVLALLGDEDCRVRHCAAVSLVKMIPNLFFAVDCPMQDPVITVAKDYTDSYFTPIVHDWAQESPPTVLGLVKPFNFNANIPVHPSVESSLSRVITAIKSLLRKCQCKYLSYGCCHALSLLSEHYLPTSHSFAWSCAPPLPVLTKDGDRPMARHGVNRKRLSSASSLRTPSTDDDNFLCGGGPLALTLSLLCSSPLALDLSAHQDTLLLAGNLLSGTAYRCLRSADETNNLCGVDDGKWLCVSDRQLVPLVDILLTHIARLLNACTHVIDDITPGPPQIKPSLPSLPTAPSLSPIKRKAKGDKDGSGPSVLLGSTIDSKASAKSTQKEREKEVEREKNRKEGLGTFYNLPQYMRVYDVLKGAYSNYKISLDLNVSDKFGSLLKVALEVFAKLLEISSLFDIGKYAEEFLTYLKTTFSMEATSTVLCVQQLLKALFGTNLSSQWELPQNLNCSHLRHGKSSRLSTNMKPGLYHCCFTHPYTQFTQSLAGAAFRSGQADQEDSTNLAWFKKRIERKTPAILKPGSRTDKSSIAWYIRLFEPLVIKALKQYTVTSSLPLQTEVLGLLSQLVQLRVNYCLLDSDQIFIGFVIKQFEYIEEGQIRYSESLVPHIFQFLVMLSYEKFHTKPIIGIPKIIQLCDGIMASGLQPTTHAIPALQPIVYDLFLLRGTNKSDGGKDLETQREVVVSMLLRLINFYQALEMFVIILQQCRKENEDRWKRLSRQVTDMVLPALAKQQVNLDSLEALDVLHHLFESVAPSVFRPVDILLKTLVAKPADVSSVTGLQRWQCLVLSLLRVIISQSKEEVVLSRLEELCLSVCILKRNPDYVVVPQVEEEMEEDQEREGAEVLAKELPQALPPENTVARFLFQVAGLVADTISQKVSNLTFLEGGQNIDFLCQQLSHLLLFVTHMFQSGLFRRVATAAMGIVQEEVEPFMYSIEEINQSFLCLGVSFPTITLQWCNILILLNSYDPHWWSAIMQTPNKFIIPSPSHHLSVMPDIPRTPVHSCNVEIVRRGALVLFCDYVCENLTDAEHMTQLIINHVNDLVELSHESPVQDLVSAIHRNSAASGLFIQAIHSRFENLTKPSLVKKTLQCLEAIHLSQSGALLTLLIDKFLHTHHLSVARICDSIACRRLETLLAEVVEESSNQLPLEDLEKLVQFIKNNGLAKRHARLASLLSKFHQVLCPTNSCNLSPERTHPLSLPTPPVADITVDKEWYLSVVKDQCFGAEPNTRECALLLQKLDYADILTVIMAKEFSPSILKECISLGTLCTLEQHRMDEMSSCLRGEPVNMSRSSEVTYEPLFQAAQLMLFRHINSVINMLPVPHQVLVDFPPPGIPMSPREIQYQEKMEDFFIDAAWMDAVFQFAASLLQYLQSLMLFPWQPAVPQESQTDVCRFIILTLEMINWLVQHSTLPPSNQIQIALEGLSVVLQNPQLANVVGQKDHISWVCTCVKTVYRLLESLMVLPGMKLAILPNQDVHDDQPKQSFDDYHHVVVSCDHISELVHCLRSHLSLSCQMDQHLPLFLIAPIRKIIVGLARLPLLNSYARTPPLVWKMGWMPSPSGEMRTKLPPLPLDYLLDKEVLKEFVFRVNSLGWISRQQFEETWMSLLGVVSSAPSMEEEHLSPEEEMERSQAMVLAVKAITSLLVQSMLTPSPGNPSNSRYEMAPRDKPLAFLHTKCGKKLATLRGFIEQHIQRICSSNPVSSNSSSRNGHPDSSFLQMLEVNLEREIGEEELMLGQISIDSIWTIVGMLEMSLSESDSPESMESPPIQRKKQTPSTTDGGRERSISVSGLDIHSCLQFLLELYGQWLSPTAKPKPPPMLVNAVVKSIVCLSDLFTERFQFEWMLETLLDVQKVHPAEDELVLQYLNVGICKSAGLVGVECQAADRLFKMLDAGLKSTHLPSKTHALHGILYILEAGIIDLTKQIIPMVTDFLLRHLAVISQASITSQQFVLTLWATAFYILENYQEELHDTDIPIKILQLAVNAASSNEESTCVSVYLAILRGLERLLLTATLSKPDAETIIKLSMDRLCLPSPQRALPALGLMLTCMYSGKQFEQFSPTPRDTVFNSSNSDPDYVVVYQDPETLILAMERITVLFDRIRKGFPYEASIVTRILPEFLADFFPPQDIMNKVIGEFISSQQPHPLLIAKVVFRVFYHLHQQNQQVLVRDWVMLSLSNFTQRTPVAMAVWSLTCFFISASTNHWLKALFPHVLGRMGKMETMDCKLFCLAALDFRRQLDENQERAFHSTFQYVAQPDSPYQELLSCCGTNS
ncbi:huntingtin isoform X2 [Octopus sinensis]|uniref:Huntingtin isoform X2 n=1 Tax=Octopus sinensis TaxID=2607531 RepID=A0A6P7T722_9MOLL|nr:huntingtin isoform X2 [Octopus sinensis]